MFKKFDANNDGAISKEEFAAGLKKVQETFHEKKERARSGAEMARHAGSSGMRPPFATPGERPQLGRQPGRTPGFARLFEHFDKNKDGKLTKDEVPAQLWERASRADANKDGAVTKDELEAFHKKMAEQRGAQTPREAKPAK